MSVLVIKQLSSQSVARIWCEDQKNGPMSEKKNNETAAHRRTRLQFAQKHQHWRTVLTTDESRFLVSSCDRRVRVWRCQGERYAECDIMENDRYAEGLLWCMEVYP